MSSNYNISIEGTSKSTDDHQMSTNSMLREELFTKVMKDKWEEVVAIHVKDRRAYKTKITSSGLTALHIAIMRVRKVIVENLVDKLINKRDNNNNIINDVDVVSEAKEILRIENNQGRTPLHIAAATGSTRMCKCIAGVDKSLVRALDKKGQTPLFRAVSYGRYRAFLCLHSIVCRDGGTDMVNDVIKYCRRDDGLTILHEAIIREHFDLAFQIIHLYKELVNCVDKEGELPLHALARKSAAFKSGINLKGRDKIIYNCISIKELEFDFEALQKYSDPKEGLKDKNPNPAGQNKQSSFLKSIRLLWRNVTRAGYLKKESCANVDLENREGSIDQTGSNIAHQKRYDFSASYISCVEYYVKLVSRELLQVVLGYGPMSMKKMHEMKEKHVWAVQVLNELLNHSTMYAAKESHEWSKRSKDQTKSNSSDDEDSRDQYNSEEEYEDNISESSKISGQPGVEGKEECSRKESTKDTPILLAAKNGVAEMVEKILKCFPVAIYDKDEYGKTVLLVAVENRNLQVYKILKNKCDRKDVVFQQVDMKGNTALHYAAMYDEHKRPWPVPGAALQMQWEIKWHEFVENTMPPRLYLRTNMDGKTPKEMFSDTHKDLVKAGSKWLTSTATSCSVVATLIATVTFASSTTAPGGTDSKNGKPRLERDPTFELFAMSSLVALCFSVTSLIMFLAILTSRHQEKDFGRDLPRKILFGLTSLFVSIASMLVAFSAGHFLMFEDKFKYAAFPMYAVTLLPLCLFAAVQFPLYFDLMRLATFWSPF